MEPKNNTKLKEIIPKGAYCYSGGRQRHHCPFWKGYNIFIKGEKVPIGECTLLQISDLDKCGHELWDQLKCCGINDDLEEV